MVSLYSTLSSSILLLVELTRGMKSEAMLTPGRPRARRGSSGLSSMLIIWNRKLFLSQVRRVNEDDYT